jgi:hypothetical protein
MIALEIIGGLLLLWLALECLGYGWDAFVKSDVAQGVAILAAIGGVIALLR